MARTTCIISASHYVRILHIKYALYYLFLCLLQAAVIAFIVHNTALILNSYTRFDECLLMPINGPVLEISLGNADVYSTQRELLLLLSVFFRTCQHLFLSLVYLIVAVIIPSMENFSRI